MKQEERNRLSRRKIVDAALAEFGQRGYSDASVNVICERSGIPKGNLYHYYKSKDEIFLACVEETFQAAMEYLNSQPLVGGVNDFTELYLASRQKFWGSHPHYFSIFQTAMLSPPAQLSGQIKSLRGEFDAQSIRLLSLMLGKERLRPGVTMEEISDLFWLYQDFVNARAAHSPEQRESCCRHAIDILLHGVVEPS